MHLSRDLDSMSNSKENKHLRENNKLLLEV